MVSLALTDHMNLSWINETIEFLQFYQHSLILLFIFIKANILI